MSDKSPTFRRLLLGRQLRELREERGMTVQQVGEALEVSTPWISRIENAQRGIQIRDLRRLLDLYGVQDESVRARLLDLARKAREHGWWHSYRSVLSSRFSEFIGLEASASSIKNFEVIVVPGLLQTESYAHALFANARPVQARDEADHLVRVRMKRQERLVGEDPPRFWAVLDEAVLRRRVGGDEVMRDQLAHILELARQPHITVQVIPLASGGHAGTSGSFVLLEFPDASADPVPYIETVAGDLYLEKKPDIQTCVLAWELITGYAPSPSDSAQMISDIMETYR